MIIYGRRRVGKTELIKYFIRDKEHIYHLVTQEEKAMQLKRTVDTIHAKYGDIEPKIDDWHDLFKYFSKVVDDKVVFVMDEFPYLMEQDKSISSQFQLFIDEYMAHKNMFLILCGSSISMMECKSPLYGRRNGQIDVEPFDFEKTQYILGEMDMKKRIEFYSVFGGTPFYLNMVDPTLTLSDNIISKICDDREILHEEPWMLLKQEFTRPTDT